MSPQPKTKTEDFHKLLTDCISSGEVPEAEVIDEIMRNVPHLPEPEQSYILAMVHIVNRDHERAMESFKKALRYDDVTIAINYLAYLGTSAHNYIHRLEIYRLEALYHDKTMRLVARNASYGIGDARLVRFYTLKMAAMHDGEERQRIRLEGEAMMQRIEKFSKAASLTSKDIEELCDKAEAVANGLGINCIGVDYFIDESGDSAYIINAETESAEILSELNFELACLLADEKYINKPFTSWFKSTPRVNGETHEC